MSVETVEVDHKEVRELAIEIIKIGQREKRDLRKHLAMLVLAVEDIKEICGIQLKRREDA